MKCCDVITSIIMAAQIVLHNLTALTASATIDYLPSGVDSILINNSSNNVTIPITTTSTSSSIIQFEGITETSSASVNVSMSWLHDRVPEPGGGFDWFEKQCLNLKKPQGFLSRVLEPIIAASGIVGIILTMIVLNRKTMCTSTNCYLTALAVADLLFLLILSMTIIVRKYADCDFKLSGEHTLLELYANIFMEIFLNLTIGVTVMLAVERYIAICHPMRAMVICTVKRARIIIFLLFIISVVLRSPKFSQVDIEYINDTLVVTWVNTFDEPIYTYIVTGALSTVIPLICLLVLNIRLIVEIHRSSRYLRYHLGAHQRERSVVSHEEIKITMMLVSVVIAFFICQMPLVVFKFIQAMSFFNVEVSKAIMKPDDQKIFQNVIHCLLALKSSCNFILYCWFSEKFWTTFKRIFCLRQCLPRQVVHQQNGCNNNSHNNSHNNVHRPSWYITKETTC